MSECSDYQSWNGSKWSHYGGGELEGGEVCKHTNLHSIKYVTANCNTASEKLGHPYTKPGYGELKLTQMLLSHVASVAGLEYCSNIVLLLWFKYCSWAMNSTLQQSSITTT